MAPMCGPLHPGIEREKRTNCCGSRIVRLHRWKYHRPAILGSKKIHPLMLRGCHFAELCTLVGRSTRPALGCGSRSSQLHTNDRCVPYFSPGPSSGIRRPTMYHVVLSVFTYQQHFFLGQSVRTVCRHPSRNATNSRRTGSFPCLR